MNRAVLGPFIVEAKAVMAAREVAAAKERRKAEAEARAAKTKEAAIAARLAGAGVERRASFVSSESHPDFAGDRRTHDRVVLCRR